MKTRASSPRRAPHSAPTRAQLSQYEPSPAWSVKRSPAAIASSTGDMRPKTPSRRRRDLDQAFAQHVRGEEGQSGVARDLARQPAIHDGRAGGRRKRARPRWTTGRSSPSTARAEPTRAGFLLHRARAAPIARCTDARACSGARTRAGPRPAPARRERPRACPRWSTRRRSNEA